MDSATQPQRLQPVPRPPGSRSYLDLTLDREGAGGQLVEDLIMALRAWEAQDPDRAISDGKRGRQIEPW